MAKSYHEKLVSKANEYIRRIHSDMSVSKEQTLDSLELLRDEIDKRIVAVENAPRGATHRLRIRGH